MSNLNNGLQSEVENTSVEISKPGFVEGLWVADIVLDTGAAKTLVRRDLVPNHKILTDKSVFIKCAHGDTVRYPLARVNIEIEGVTYCLEVAVSDKIPMSVLLGRDVPQLVCVHDAATGARNTPQMATSVLAVTTRAKERETERRELEISRREKEGGAVSSSMLEERMSPNTDDSTTGADEPVTEEGDAAKLDHAKAQPTEEEWLGASFDDSIFLGKEPANAEESANINVGPEEITKLQQTDETLAKIREATKVGKENGTTRFYEKKGLLCMENLGIPDRGRRRREGRTIGPPTSMSSGCIKAGTRDSLVRTSRETEDSAENPRTVLLANNIQRCSRLVSFVSILPEVITQKGRSSASGSPSNHRGAFLSHSNGHSGTTST